VSDRLDWKVWHHDYDDPDSSVSHRLVEVRARLAGVLADGVGQVWLLSICAGDARDVIPVVAVSDCDVEVTLVELDPELADRARRAADAAGVRVDVRTGDAGDPEVYAGLHPVDVLVMVGVLGNVSDADARTTVAAAGSLVAEGGTVIWSRSNRFRAEPTHGYEDPAVWVRDLFEAQGFETVDYLRPDQDAWRLGVSRLAVPSRDPLPERIFTFVR